jgi:DNA-binding XRE family transcriptional regulator
MHSAARTPPVTIGPQMVGPTTDAKARDMTDLIGTAPAIVGRRSICESGLPTALAPASSGSRARRWFVVADGQRLRQLRREQRLSQEALARRAGISVGTIGQLERQAYPSCRGRTLARLAAALGAQPTALMPMPLQARESVEHPAEGRPISTHGHPEPCGAVGPGTSGGTVHLPGKQLRK